MKQERGFTLIEILIVTAIMGVALAVIASANKSQPTGGRDAAFSGATAGGLIGLGVGLYLVYNGITFSPGAPTFTRIPNRPSSRAAVRPRPKSPALLAA